MNNKNLALKVVILLSYTYTMMATTLIMPIMGNLAMQFPQAGTKISMLISLPALIMIPAIPLAGYLSNFISKKTILVFGSILYIIGGFGGGLRDDIDFILLMRAIGGIGTGLVFPLVPALIAQLYEGQQVPQMIGWGNATGGLCAMIFSAVCGYLAVIDWHYAFYIYLIYAFLLIAQIIILPKVPPEKQDALMLKNEEKPRVNWLAYVYVFAAFIYMVTAMVYIMKVAIFIMEENLGNSANAGLASSVATFVSLIISLWFGKIFKTLKRYTAVVGFVSSGLCFFLLSIAHSFNVIVVASVFMGISLGTVLAYTMTMITRVVPKGAQTTGVSFVSTAMYIGQFLAAYYIQTLESFSNGTSRVVFSIVAIHLLVVAIIAIIFILTTKNKIDQYSSNNNMMSANKG